MTRREILAGSSLSLLAPLAAVHTPAPSRGALAWANGTVYHDLAGTGKGPGLAGVMVSNGCDVAVTDRAGRWCLPVREGDHVFVVKPPHWETPVSETGLSRFSHLHQPQGTPAAARLSHAGPPPSGALPASIDFPLRRIDEPSRFDVALVADTQPATAVELGYVEQSLVRAMATLRPSFAIHHGDVMADDLSLFPAYLDILARTGIRWHHCPGNHDLNLDAASPQHAFETWKRHIGPPHYAFQVAGATFILLNNVEYSGAAGKAYGGRRYRGGVGARQLAFVRNVLAHVPRESLIVVSMHIPLVSFENPESPSDSTRDRDALLALLAARPHAVSFSGHSHTTEHHYLEMPARSTPHHHHVLSAVSGSWWSGPCDESGVPCSDSRDGSPRGMHVLSIDGNRYSTRLVPLSGERVRQMRILTAQMAGDEGLAEPSVRAAAHSLIAAPSCGRQLIVDVFDGGPKTRVSFEVEGTGLGPIEMQRTATADPHVVESVSKTRPLWKPWVEPAVSSHIWTAPLPVEFSRGDHVFTVKVVGEYGAEHSAQSRPVIEA